MERKMIKMSELVNKIKTMIEAPSCCAELKAAGQAYLDASGTAGEAAAKEALLREIDEDITPIDALIAFAESPAGAKVFGDGAAGMAAKAKEVKAAGGRYCFCDACTNALAVREMLRK